MSVVNTERIPLEHTAAAIKKQEPESVERKSTGITELSLTACFLHTS